MCKVVTFLLMLLVYMQPVSTLTCILRKPSWEIAEQYGDQAADIMSRKAKAGLMQEHPDLPGEKIYKIWEASVETNEANAMYLFS